MDNTHSITARFNWKGYTILFIVLLFLITIMPISNSKNKLHTLLIGVVPFIVFLALYNILMYKFVRLSVTSEGMIIYKPDLIRTVKLQVDSITDIKVSKDYKGLTFKYANNPNLSELPINTILFKSTELEKVVQKILEIKPEITKS